ncbi:MAG: TldD/PmbA family protein [Gemmatimonadales bacterium]|nr:TldD/PmbA family protein [Gemmatimonadales bacterium]
MPPYSEAEARALLDRVMKLSRAEGCEANLLAIRSGNVRFARNAVSTSGVTDDATLSVRARYGRKVGTAQVNQFDDRSLARTLRRAEELARLAPEDPEVMPLLEPQRYAGSPNAFVEATAAITPDLRSEVAATGIATAKNQSCVAAGFLVDAVSWSATRNSRGLFGYYADTDATYSVTVRTENGEGSGWAGRDVNDIRALDAEAAARLAADKAVASRDLRTMEPGKYSVILEPAASVDLIQLLLFNNGAREADEGRSFLSSAGGATKLGRKLVDERVTIYSDPTNPDLPCRPWDDEGLPRGRTSWIERGVVRNLRYNRYWAGQQKKPPIAAPGNWIMEGAEGSLEDLIRSTDRAVLVTRTWYIREVDPESLLYTGLTRDGTFLVENGRIAYAIKNFRFNESPVTMLNNLDALGSPVRAQGAQTAGRVLLPPMRIRDFTFSSLSDAV